MTGLGAHLTQESLGLSLDKLADWSAARAEPVRLFMHDLLGAEISHPAGAGGTAFDPGQSFAGSLLRPYLLVFVGLALLYGEVTELHGRYAIILLGITFTGLILVAVREVRRKQKRAIPRQPLERNGS